MSEGANEWGSPEGWTDFDSLSLIAILGIADYLTRTASPKLVRKGTQAELD